MGSVITPLSHILITLVPSSGRNCALKRSVAARPGEDKVPEASSKCKGEWGIRHAAAVLDAGSRRATERRDNNRACGKRHLHDVCTTRGDIWILPGSSPPNRRCGRILLHSHMPVCTLPNARVSPAIMSARRSAVDWIW